MSFVTKFMLILFYIRSVTSTDCNFKELVIVNETERAGTVLLTSTKPVSVNVSLAVVFGNGQPTNAAFRNELSNSFSTWQNETYVAISLTKPLDLEKFHENYSADISNVQLQINCSGIKGVHVAVQPVNEFAPVFKNAPYSLNLPESTNVDEVIFDFKSKVYDRDVGKETNLFISLTADSGNMTNGQSHFDIPVVTSGELELTKPVDYDADNAIRHFVLNISVQDDGGLINETQLTINVQDVDDQNPYFVFPGCSQPCLLPQFDAITELSYTGTLKIIPASLQGQDKDTLNTTLIYSISAGNEHNLFTINKLTAQVTQIQSVISSKLPDASFRLIIEVKKNLTIDLSNKAILVVHVKERKQNDSGYPPEVEPKSDDSSNLLIPLIILSVVSAIILVVFIVFLLIYKKNHNSMLIVPDKNKNKRFASKNGMVPSPATGGGVVTNENASVVNNTGTTKSKLKKRKKRKSLKKNDSDSLERKDDADKVTDDQPPEPLVNLISVPVTPSFNRSLPLPQIGNGAVTENGSNSLNKTTGKQLYPSLSDAFQSDPPSWQRFRDPNVAFNPE